MKDDDYTSQKKLDFSRYYNNLKKLCLNYYSRRSYYKYMVVFAI